MFRSAPATEGYPINAYELASRLSFFIWSSIPDDELLRLLRAHGREGAGEEEEHYGAAAQRREPQALALRGEGFEVGGGGVEGDHGAFYT